MGVFLEKLCRFVAKIYDMLSKNKIKYIHSLELKKNRFSENSFVAEGPKVVGDLLPHMHCRLLVALPEWLVTHPSAKADEIVEATADELSRASFLRAPQDVLGVFSIPKSSPSCMTTDLMLALDEVQDPGNLGTIIRLADWFGIRQIVCSEGTVDAFSPKVVQATMGAIARVNIRYVSLPSFLSSLPEGTPVYGTFLDGHVIYDAPLSESGIIVMGNEGNGISHAVADCVTDRLFIPSFPVGVETSESLNVAVATAITCSEFRRRRR